MKIQKLGVIPDLKEGFGHPEEPLIWPRQRYWDLGMKDDLEKEIEIWVYEDCAFEEGFGDFDGEFDVADFEYGGLEKGDSAGDMHMLAEDKKKKGLDMKMEAEKMEKELEMMEKMLKLLWDLKVRDLTMMV